MKRRLFNFFTALSLLLLAAASVMWVRSFYVSDECRFDWHRMNATEIAVGHWNCWYARGGVTVLRETRYYPLGSGWPEFFNRKPLNEFRHGRLDFRLKYSYPLMDDSPNVFHQFGFGAYRQRFPGYEAQSLGDSVETAATVPFYSVCLVFLALPALYLKRKVYRKHAGSCERCGYDLRATPERCPECGSVPLKATGKPVGHSIK